MENMFVTVYFSWLLKTFAVNQDFFFMFSVVVERAREHKIVNLCI